MRASGQALEFERHRMRLQNLAQRLLGRREAAEEVVQEAWLRLQTAQEEVRAPGGWLTTIVTRLCLDELRARSRREPPRTAGGRPLDVEPDTAIGPEEQVMLAEAVGAALFVVLDRLPPSERVAFVLHDVFDIPFDEIAPLVDRSTAATRQLASRGRRRVRGAAKTPPAVLDQHRRVTERFLAAAREGDLPALLQLLDPAVTLKSDPCAATLPAGPGRELIGSDQVAAYFAGRGAGAASVALLDGRVGIIVAPQDRLLLALRADFRDERIVSLQAVAASEALSRLNISLAG